MLSTPVTSFDGLPLVLTLEDLVQIFRRGKSTILRDLKAGTFPVKPFRADPYQWLRSDVQRYFDRLQRLPARADSRRGNRRKKIA